MSYFTAGGPDPGYFQTTNEGAPGPSNSGTGDALDLNSESVRDAPGQSREVAQGSAIRMGMSLGWREQPMALTEIARPGPRSGVPNERFLLVGVREAIVARWGAIPDSLFPSP